MTRHALIPALVLAVFTAAAQADSITLRDGAVDPAARVVTLADIADLDGDWARARAELVVAEMPAGQAELVVKMGDVRRTLDEKRVHWGKLSLRGGRSLTVTRRAAIEAPAAPQAEAQATVAANPTHEITIAGAQPVVGVTLREHVRRLIERTHGVSSGDLRITRLQEDSPAWSLTDADCRFELEPMDRDLLGRVPIVVRRWRDDALLGSERVSVDVAVRRTVVTVKRAVQRNQTLTAEDVAAETRWMTQRQGDEIGSVDEVVGQVAARTIRAGTALGRNDIRPELMVRRGQRVAVRAISGGLVVQTLARAQEDGGLGQLIEVRNDQTRERFSVKITGPRQAVMPVGGQGNEDQGGRT